MEDEAKTRRFYAVRLEDDIPKSGKGMFIPSVKQTSSFTPRSIPAPRKSYVGMMAVLVAPVMLATLIWSVGGIGINSAAPNNVAAVQSGVESFNTVTPLNYGVQIELASPIYFAETRDAFIDAGKTFVEVDLDALLLRYFKEGVLTLSAPILAKGEKGSWWETPSGLYEIELKKDEYFSSVGQMYQPWTLVFGGNFAIHGWPTLKSGNDDVPTDFSSGGIRLETDLAEKLYDVVEKGTVVLVHSSEEATDSFVYEPKIPELLTPHYLIADIESSTVLASSDLEAVAPIASVTKLMTAVIAAEHINLDSTISVGEPTFVESLIPRLGERSRVSMYSLLQLLLVESSNEAAEVIAGKLGKEEFVSLMNQKARQLGMLKTHFSDTSGLSAENASSLSDLFRLTQYIYKNRSFIFELTANQHLKTAHVGDEFGELANFNEVEGLDNFMGGKVGETIAAGQTSVTLHQIEVKGEKRVVAIIILGSESRNEDVTKLLNYATERFGE
jgi:hypothetical protein